MRTAPARPLPRSLPAQASGQARLGLTMVVRNGEIWRQIILQIVQHNPTGILLIATNPVDLS